MKSFRTILIAPDSFKGSISSKEVCVSIESGLLLAAPDANILKTPLADGGEGTVQAFIENLGGRYRSLMVSNPLATQYLPNMES